ncbi:MAG: flagellar type III secretion system pore protein FliP [Pseudomonadota bacterium]
MRFLVAVFLVLIATESGFAQTIDLNNILEQDQNTYAGRIIQGLVLLTVLSLAPGLLITTTCFTRFVIAFSFLRSGLGLQSTPSNLIVISLALFMTYFVMAPVFEDAWKNGINPMLENRISQEQGLERTAAPFKKFMLAHIREKDLKLFQEFVSDPGQEVTDVDDLANQELRTIIPAFLLSEIRKGFEIGFLILLPFLVIDLVVSTLTMSMGMMMLPPTVVSLPFKVLFFVLIDGWNLLVEELLKSVI